MYSSSNQRSLHIASQFTSQPSTSGLAHRYPALPSLRSRNSNSSSSSSSSRPWHSQRCQSAAAGDASQVYRFRHQYKPQKTQQPTDTLLGWPLQEDATQSDRFAVATEQTRLDPAGLWDKEMPPGSIELNNAFAQQFRATKVAMPQSFSLPGTEYWQVEALNDYSRDWPSLKRVDGSWQFRKGFLEPFDDPKVVPFFFYRGLEALKYSWGERAFQVLVAAAYTAVHVAIFGWFWQSNQALAIAVGLNWGLGQLTIAKWALLLILASHERLWMYFAFLVAQQIDRGLAALLPPVRRFFWAMFTVWALFVVFSPAHYYPLPFAPFAPGSLGVQEALI